MLRSLCISTVLGHFSPTRRLVLPVARRANDLRNFATMPKGTPPRSILRMLPSRAEAVLTKKLGGYRTFSSAVGVAQPSAVYAAATPDKWNISIRYIHWAMAAGIITCFATVQAGYLTEGDRKDGLINVHNQVGLAMGALVVARLGVRAMSRLPPEIPGNAIEHLAAKAGHAALYAFMIFMPATGFGMYYLGGRSVNLLGAELKGLEDPSRDRMTWAKECFKKHKLVGEFFQYLVMLHIGAAGYHMIRGHNIISRIAIF